MRYVQVFDPSNVPEFEAGEVLSRFVTQSGQFRPSDKYVKQNAFLPYPRRDLSVTRQRELIGEEIWMIGRNVASQLKRRLYGRSDIDSGECDFGPLRIVAAPLSDNPHHADVTNWPTDKADQKMLALEIARVASPLIEPPAD
jgi:hypothetical protein